MGVERGADDLHPGVEAKALINGAEPEDGLTTGSLKTRMGGEVEEGEVSGRARGGEMIRWGQGHGHGEKWRISYPRAHRRRRGNLGLFVLIRDHPNGTPGLRTALFLL